MDSLSAKTVSQQRLVLAVSVPESESRSPPAQRATAKPGALVPSATCDPAGQRTTDLQQQRELDAKRVDDERKAREAQVLAAKHRAEAEALEAKRLAESQSP